MGNTSSTGGYLTPDDSLLPEEDLALEDIFQQTIVGLTGLPGRLVRPMWQPVMPKIPEPGVTWCAFGISTDDPDANPVVTNLPDANEGNGGVSLQRHEHIKLQCTFHGPHGQAMATRARDGLAISQNNSMLQVHYSIGLISTGQIINIPELINQQWVRRYDFFARFRRKVTRSYPVFNLLSAPINIQRD